MCTLQRTAIACIQQAQSAAHYLPLNVTPSRMDSGPVQVRLSFKLKPQRLKDHHEKQKLVSFGS